MRRARAVCGSRARAVQHLPGRHPALRAHAAVRPRLPRAVHHAVVPARDAVVPAVPPGLHVRAGRRAPRLRLFFVLAPRPAEVSFIAYVAGLLGSRLLQLDDRDHELLTELTYHSLSEQHMLEMLRRLEM